MKPKSPKQESPLKVLRLWSHAEATKALPYIRSVVGSVREHWLELNGAKQRLRRLEQAPGRPDRRRLLERQAALEESERAAHLFEDTHQELMALDIFCIDPAAGLALIPFRQGDELAWFVFDLFDPKPLEAWRLHRDPLETRRPVPEAAAPAPKAALTDVDPSPPLQDQA